MEIVVVLELVFMVCADCKPLSERLEKAEKRIAVLEHKLLSYENAHTPNSKLRFPPRTSSSNCKKPGQKPGHKGITRKTPVPTMTVEVFEDNCPYCQATLSKPFKTTSRVVEEIPEPKPVEVTEYKINHYLCACCGTEVVAQAPIPNKSCFGTNTMAHVTLLKFDDRLPHRKVCSTLKRQFNLEMSAATVLDITQRVSNKLSAEYNKIRTALRKSKAVNVDETGFRVGGLNFHLWAFTNKEVTLYVIRRSRAKGVIEEVLDESYDGTIGCDGWTAYSQYSNNLQRCWAHLLREAKYLAQQHSSAKSLYTGLKKIFRLAKRKKPPSKKKLILEMRQWTDYAECYRELRKFAVTIKNGIEHWFTFVSNTHVEPTNNRAERALRELIVQRKIMGTLRNEKGITIMERINTCLTTWKQQGLNPFHELKTHLC